MMLMSIFIFTQISRVLMTDETFKHAWEWRENQMFSFFAGWVKKLPEVGVWLTLLLLLRSISIAFFKLRFKDFNLLIKRHKSMMNGFKIACIVMGNFHKIQGVILNVIENRWRLRQIKTWPRLKWYFSFTWHHLNDVKFPKTTYKPTNGNLNLWAMITHLSH